ncbi:Soluble pyridine nucleotide transhydrogenase [Seminavis robusta]|uniref:NAD(P)(+) transhydrogenase (Si-specific) n=1 Tax=Seminavis robusta TaxID=568900 RepID=A0A9N8H7Y5_9STRA|nr:Soluble pyridine nucleotide transhydrogenase [Seminavis robusta]|eukprot:Sro78_g042530.1 Soluble pyridine nucleotide transhydrogenase (597) ;mRNA; f:86339-88588
MMISQSILPFYTLAVLCIPTSHAFQSSLNPRAFARSRQTSLSVTEGGYDLAVIGGGVVGVQAALTAASSPMNKKVALIDAPRASGVLMNEETGEDLSLGAPTGLFSKALRDTSKNIKVASLRGMGLREESVWNEIISNCVELASSNAQDVRRQLDFAGVTYIEGYASFPDSGGSDTISVDEPDGTVHIVRAKKYLIATGSKAFRPGGIPFDGKQVFDSDTINQISFLPKSIAITGSGIIAVEYAKVFSNLGSKVTLIIRDQVPRNALMKIGLDKDVAATLVADLIRSGVKIIRGAQVKEFYVPPPPASGGQRLPVKIEIEAKGGGPLPSGVERETEIKVDAYVAAVGRKPNTVGLNLERAGIDVDEYGGILVDSQLRATAKGGNVYAAGDVVGRPFLASTGSAQGRAALSAMFAEPTSGNATEYATCDPEDETCVEGGMSQAGESFDPTSLAANPFAFPCGVWSSPEAAYFGLSVQQAADMGIEAGEGIALYSECLRGLVFSPNGLLKIVYEKPAGRILGVHICGDDACELIHYGMELVKGRRTVIELSSTLYSAVTFHEMYKIAAQAALDEVGARKRRAAAGKALAKRLRDASLL